MFKHFALAISAVIIGGCATAIRGTTNQVTFASEPSGAVMTTSLGHSCVTPCVIAIERNKTFEATFRKDGYQHAVVAVRTEVSREGGTSFAGNILAGGIIGMGVDAANGATLDHTPNPVVGRLAAIVPAAPPPGTNQRPVRRPSGNRTPISSLTAPPAQMTASVSVGATPR
jgi:hypothetical protein